MIKVNRVLAGMLIGLSMVTMVGCGSGDLIGHMGGFEIKTSKPDKPVAIKEIKDSGKFQAVTYEVGIVEPGIQQLDSKIKSFAEDLGLISPIDALGQVYYADSDYMSKIAKEGSTIEFWKVSNWDKYRAITGDKRLKNEPIYVIKVSSKDYEDLGTYLVGMHTGSVMTETDRGWEVLFFNEDSNTK